jgi:hypothetical protein
VLSWLFLTPRWRTAQATISPIADVRLARHFLTLDAFTCASDADIARVARPWVTTGVDPASG